jgi:hypothetical protein
MAQERTFEVTIKCGNEVNIDAAMDKAMFVLSDRIWADCTLEVPWEIKVSEGGKEQEGLGYTFTPEDADLPQHPFPRPGEDDDEEN